MEAFEILVGVDPRELRWLYEAIQPSALGESGLGGGPPVRVGWTLHGLEFTWRGQVTRFERVDEVTRTARMVVEVRLEDMTASVAVGGAGLKPELSIGMYCRTELPVEPLVDALLVPRHAIYESRWVYVFEPSKEAPNGRLGRLGRRAVPMLRSVGDSVLVDYPGREGTEVCELRPGERVVVSRLLTPVVGMQVSLQEEDTATAVAHVPIGEQPRRAHGPRVVIGATARAPAG
jgi:hypothetical protein